MKDFTYVSSYYDQPHLAEKWWDCYRGWSDDLIERVKFIFVDDGSPNHPLEVPEWFRERFDVRHFRVTVDIPWNEMGARNLAMKEMVTEWALLMDADYVLTNAEAHRLLTLNPRPRDLYFPRARPAGEQRHLHHPVNLFLVHRDTFWKCGGYHEAYAGGYGLSDTEFLRVHAHGLRGLRHKLEDVWIDHFERQMVTAHNRSLTRNDRIFKARLKMSHRIGVMKLAGQNSHLQFPWEEIK